MGNIIEDFSEVFGLKEDQARKRDEHYQITGSKNKRITDNAKKLAEVFTTHEVNFDIAFNILTKKVLPNALADRFLEVKYIGEQRYSEFVAQKVGR